MTRDRADGTLPMEFGRSSSSTPRCMTHAKRVLGGTTSQLQRKRIALAMDGSSARCRKRSRRGASIGEWVCCCGNGGAAALACACLEAASLIGAHRHGVSAQVGFEEHLTWKGQRRKPAVDRLLISQQPVAFIVADLQRDAWEGYTDERLRDLQPIAAFAWHSLAARQLALWTSLCYPH